MENKLSRSNGVEIISILWFILAALTLNNVVFWISIVMGFENIIESICFAVKFKGE